MFKAIKEFFFGKPNAGEAQAPYKVEAKCPVTQPEPVKCGCSRSPTGNCVGLHKLTEAEWAVHPDNPNKAQPVTESKVDAVSVALDLEPMELSGTAGKKPRKPRTPKAATEKPAKEKAAKPKKAAAVKAEKPAKKSKKS